MFADDCTIFCRATKEAANEVKTILDHYYTIFGQLINYHKCIIQLSIEQKDQQKKI